MNQQNLTMHYSEGTVPYLVRKYLSWIISKQQGIQCLLGSYLKTYFDDVLLYDTSTFGIDLHSIFECGFWSTFNASKLLGSLVPIHSTRAIEDFVFETIFCHRWKAYLDYVHETLVILFHILKRVLSEMFYRRLSVKWKTIFWSNHYSHVLVTLECL